MKTCSSWLLACMLSAGVITVGETVKDREGAVRSDRAAMENDPRWIYNDWERGFSEAKRTGKPVLVVLRCVPCLACAGIDAQVLEEAELAPLLDQFVCVRLINANSLDLSIFQFDYDLSFSTMFFNGDRTVYGRYGSWTHQRDAQNETTAGFKRALEGALALHRQYPGIKAQLAGKAGDAFSFKSPLEMPTIAGKYARDLNWEGKVVQSCVHCHQVGDAMRASFRDAMQPIPEQWVYPFPTPETIGLTLDPGHAARVESIAPGSIAGKSGFRAGDDLLTLDGQPLLSIADVSWALHRAPASGSIPALVKRSETNANLQIALPPEWRKNSDISRRVGTWPMRAMALGGLVVEDLPDDERTRWGLPKNQLALRVKHVGQYSKHAAAKHAGVHKDDILIEFDGISTRMSEGALIGHLLQKRSRGDRVEVTVLRGSEKVSLNLPMQ